MEGKRMAGLLEKTGPEHRGPGPVRVHSPALPGYPLLGCSSALPNSVSPGHTKHNPKKSSGNPKPAKRATGSWPPMNVESFQQDLVKANPAEITVEIQPFTGWYERAPQWPELTRPVTVQRSPATRADAILRESATPRRGVDLFNVHCLDGLIPAGKVFIIDARPEPLTDRAQLGCAAEERHLRPQHRTPLQAVSPRVSL